MFPSTLAHRQSQFLRTAHHCLSSQWTLSEQLSKVSLRHTAVAKQAHETPLQKMTAPQLVTIFPAFYGIQKFITAFTTVHHLCLSCDMNPAHTLASCFLEHHSNIILSLISEYGKRMC